MRRCSRNAHTHTYTHTFPQEIFKTNYGMDVDREEVNPGGANFGNIVFEVRACLRAPMCV